MPASIRNLAVGVLARAPTVLTLALLAGVAVWGARTGWKAPRFSALWGEESGPAEASPEAAVKVIPGLEGPTAGGSPAATGSFSRIEFPSAEAVRRAGIRTAAAELRPVAQYVTANGMLDYEHSGYAELASRAPGSVWRVNKALGDPVRKGEVLALIEAAEVGQAKADLVQELTQLDVRTKALQRLQSAGRAVSEAALREAETSVREARIRLLATQQRLLNLGLVLRLDELTALSEDQLVRHLRLLGLPEAIRRETDPETLTANLLPLTAPFDGKVVFRRVGPGEVVDTKRPLFAVGDVRHLHIELEVHVEDASRLKLGQRVLFTPEFNPAEQAVGGLVHISPEVNEKTRNVQVHADLDNSDEHLLPHTFGVGRIVIREQPRAVVVPAEALQSDGRTYLVFVRVSDQCFERRQVQPGLRDGNRIEVGGVQAGETVVTTGSHVLKSELLKDRISGGDD